MSIPVPQFSAVWVHLYHTTIIYRDSDLKIIVNVIIKDMPNINQWIESHILDLDVEKSDVMLLYPYQELINTDNKLIKLIIAPLLHPHSLSF